MSDTGGEPRGGPEGLEPDPLAERLTPDGAVILEGILGKGPTEDNWYLFLNRELTRRAEFKASDVLHSEKIREEDSPFLGAQATRVYLRRSARVVYTTTQSREVQAEFLKGDIGTGVTAEAVTARPPGAREAFRAWPQIIDRSFSPWECGSAVDACPPSFGLWPCGSAVDACPSWFCPPQTRDERCVSGIVACSKFCGSPVDACPSALGCSAFDPCPR